MQAVNLYVFYLTTSINQLHNALLLLFKSINKSNCNNQMSTEHVAWHKRNATVGYIPTVDSSGLSQSIFKENTSLKTILHTMGLKIFKLHVWQTNLKEKKQSNCRHIFQTLQKNSKGSSIRDSVKG